MACYCSPHQNTKQGGPSPLLPTPGGLPLPPAARPCWAGAGAPAQAGIVQLQWQHTAANPEPTWMPALPVPTNPAGLLNHAAEQEEQELLKAPRAPCPGEHTGHRMNIKDCLPARGVATPRYGTRVVCTRMGEDGKPTGLEISGGSQIRAHAAAASISSSSAAPCAPCSMQAHVPPRAAVGNENTGVRGKKTYMKETGVFILGLGVVCLFVCLLLS